MAEGVIETTNQSQDGLRKTVGLLPGGGLVRDTRSLRRAFARSPATDNPIAQRKHNVSTS